MSTVGWLGLGKLGSKCADTLASCGHDVIGYDPKPPKDPGAVKLGTLADVVSATDGLVLVCVQTPHAPAYGGEQPMPGEPRDFDYSALVQAVRDVAAEAIAQDRRGLTIVIISTVLPGTTRARLLPLLRGTQSMRLVYGPYFPAMGTERDDFLHPEFQLLGADDPVAAAMAEGLYETVHDAPIRHVSIESAELAKVAYNAAVTMKICYANWLSELCDATGADVDEVTGTLALATKRILSPAYLRAGMGDGGGCHPRDGIALSGLSRRAGASADVAGFLVAARESQSERLAELVKYHNELTRLPVLLLGKAFKPGIAMQDGSPALLLRHQLREMGVETHAWDPHVDHTRLDITSPRLFVVATAHPEFADLELAPGSVVIDPHGMMPSRPGVTLITPGRKR